MNCLVKKNEIGTKKKKNTPQNLYQRNEKSESVQKICFIAVLWWFHRVGKYVISRAMLKFREGMLRDLVILKLQI